MISFTQQERYRKIDASRVVAQRELYNVKNNAVTEISASTINRQDHRLNLESGHLTMHQVDA